MEGATAREGGEVAPGAEEVLLKLFDYLDERLPHDGCDHTLKLTLAWSASEGLDGERVAEWTHAYGGFCDCEVSANVESNNPAFGGI